MANKGGRGASGRKTINWRSVLLGGRAINTTNSFWSYNARYSLDHHTGVDFGASRGTPINIPFGGKVVAISTGGAYGKTVVVKMDDGYYMRFAHMDSIAVSNRQRVKAGGFVGRVGNTGASTGPHLHLEVMKPSSGGRFGANSFVNPVAYLNGKRTYSAPEAPSKAADSRVPAPGRNDPDWDGTGSSMFGDETIFGTGGGMNMAKFSKKDFYEALSAMYGNIDILLKLDKEAQLENGGKSIKWAVDKMVKDKITSADRARTILAQTAWFKKHSEEQTRRLIMERERPQLAQSEIAKQRATISDYLAQVGVKISDAALNTMARNSWIFDWSSETWIDEIQKSKDVSFVGGEIAANIADLETFADDYGVRLSEADIRQARMDYLDKRGDQGVRDLIEQRAAQTYSIWADEIKAGRSVKSLAGAYFTKAAELLEVDPDSIAWDDPLFKDGRAFMAVDANTGKPAQRTLWDFEKEIRKDSRWMNTANAKSAIMQSTSGILKTMGLI